MLAPSSDSESDAGEIEELDDVHEKVDLSQEGISDDSAEHVGIIVMVVRRDSRLSNMKLLPKRLLV